MVTVIAPPTFASDLDDLDVGREPLTLSAVAEAPGEGDEAADAEGAPGLASRSESAPEALRPELDPSRSSGGSANAEELLRPGTRPMFFNLAFGPTFFAVNSENRFGGRGRLNRSRGKLAFDFGYHFSGEFDGPAIGATIEQTIDDNLYTFHPGFKFWWDIQVVEEYEIDITPFADVGYMFLSFDDFRDEHAFVFAFGVEGRVLLDDRWVLLFRPIHVQNLLTSINNNSFLINFSVLVGGGVTF